MAGGFVRPGGGAESQKGTPFSEALETVVVEIEAQECEGCWSRVVCSLACGKVDMDPL